MRLVEKNILVEFDCKFQNPKNIQAMAIEMFKTKSGIGPLLLQNIFKLNEACFYNLRGNSDFLTPSIAI